MIESADNILSTKRYDATAGSSVDFGSFWAFRSASLSFLKTVFGVDHPHYKEFDHIVRSASPGHTEAGAGILQTVREEIKGGWVANLKSLVSAEIFGDFIVLAKETMDDSTEVSAVLACAALEDALKRLALREKLDIEGRDMSKVIGALKKNGIITGAQASVVSSYVKLRNKAFHAEWDKIQKPEVASAIEFAEKFILENFG